MLKLRPPRFKSARKLLNLIGTATQRPGLKIYTRVVKILSDTAERRDSGVWVFKFIRRTGRFGACGELLNFESELRHGSLTQEF